MEEKERALPGFYASWICVHLMAGVRGFEVSYFLHLYAFC